MHRKLDRIWPDVASHHSMRKQLTSPSKGGWMLQMLQMLQTPRVKETETKWYHTGLKSWVSMERRGFNPNLHGVSGSDT